MRSSFLNETLQSRSSEKLFVGATGERWQPTVVWPFSNKPLVCQTARLACRAVLGIYTLWTAREGGIFVFLLPFVLSRVAPSFDQWLGLPSNAFSLPTFLLGIILILFGLSYALWSIITQLIRARGTPLPMMATKKLLVSGPFKHCRNPMSFGTILLYLGISILIGSISAIVIVFAFTIGLIIYIKQIEERELEIRFGEEYLAYKAEIPFLIPRIFSGR